jgi:hypothetical protein
MKMKFSDFTAKVLTQLHDGYGWATPWNTIENRMGALDIIHDAYGRGVSDAVDSRPDWKGWVEQAALSIAKKQEE